MTVSIELQMEQMGQRAKKAARVLSAAAPAAKTQALRALAALLIERQPDILKANALDVDAAKAAGADVIVGVGGGITTGMRSVRLAIQAEHQGAYGVVLNAPTSNEVVRQIKEVVDIPVVITVVSAHTDIRSRLAAGVDFLNVSGAAATPEIVAEIRRDFPDVPIIATGGPTEESILRTIRAGANAVTYTPPTNGALFAQIMEKHRKTL